jgi:hypothetical protein
VSIAYLVGGALVGAAESCVAIITAKIFADALPAPIVQVLNLNINVERVDVDAIDALR